MGFSLGTIWAEIGVNTSKLDAGLMQAQIKIANADKQFNTFGQKLSLASTKLITAGGLMAGSVAAVGIASIKMASEFETSMRNVNSIAKLSEEQFKAQSKEVVELSKKLPQSAKVLADGLYDISSSGFAGADGMKVLEAAAKAASAGMTNTATSAKGITAVLNAYGFSAEEAGRVSDTMFKTVDKGVITFEELSSTVGDWIGMAKAANLSFEEASGAIAFMTTKGLAAEEAGVSLTRMLTGLIKPSEEMAEVIRQAGFESGELMLKQLGLTGTMEILNEATGGSITKLIELIPEIRGVRGANALLGSGYEELTDYMKNFNDTTGATQAALEEQSKSLSFQLDLLKNNAKALGIDIGEKLIPPLTKLVKNLNELSPEAKDATLNVIKLGGGAVGSVGGVLLFAGVLGKLRNALLALNVGGVAAGGALTFGVAGGITNLVTAITGYVDIVKKAKDGTYSWQETVTRLISPMLQLLDNIDWVEHKFKVAFGRPTVDKLNDSTQSTSILSNEMLRLKNNIGDVTGEFKRQSEATEESKEATDELIASLHNLYNLNQSVTEATWGYEDSLKELTDIMVNANATERDKQSAIFATQDALENLQIAMIKEYEATDTSIERKKELQKQYTETGLKAVSSGAMSAEAFISMASQFGVSKNDIVKFANEMGAILDNQTRQRIIRLSLDTSGFDTSLSAAVNRLNSLDRRMGMYAMGGIVGKMPGYAHGGIIGKASMGMVVPQTGRAIPILAHEGEMILNDSQQGNLINALWGVANGKGGGGMNVNLTVISQNPLTPSDIARETTNALRLYGLEAALN